MKPILPSLVLAFVLLASATGHAASQATLVEKGRSKYRIVVPADAIAAERFAAEEMQVYLERISGVRLPIVTDAEKLTSREIVLGDGARLRKLGVRLDTHALGDDGFVVQWAKDRLVIAGARPRGTLNGVHTFLEEQLGVRWYTPELEVVPRTNRVRLAKASASRSPALEYREVFWTEMMRNGDFASRHRLNGDHCRLEAKHGGAAVSYFPFVHSFDALVPPALFESHPEYFPLIDGKRKGGYVQRCLTNPDVLRLSIERVREWIRDHPEATILSVSQNDTINYCQCDACRAIDDAEGTPCGSLLKFVNAVAAAIEADHPKVRIDTLAYQYTRMAPKTLRPHRNVIIRLCSIECCFAHPFADCPSKANQRFCEDIVAWQPVAPLLYVWDYTPNFAHYQQIFPNFDALQPNVQFFVKHGVKGLFEQGNYSSGGMGEMGPLRSYVLAKLLWNPDTDVARHIREFTDAYYGRAGAKIREYLELTHQPVRGTECHAHIFDGPKSCYLPAGTVAEAEQLLIQAEQLAGEDPQKFRVQVATLPVWYAQLSDKKLEGWPRTQLLRRFLEVARKAGVSNISESKDLATWAKEMGAE